MPKPSQRGTNMPESPIRKLVPLANKACEKGIKIYHLNIGQPDLKTPQAGLDALRAVDRSVLEYSPSEGILSLRQKLAEYYHRFDIDVTAEDIIITTGGSEAVLFAFMACLDPGDEIIVPEPAYANYTAFAMLEMYNEYVERRKFLIDGINKIPGCYTPIPMGAFYTVARLPIDDADRFCAWLLEEFEYEGQTVMIAPASGFYTTPDVGKNEVRLAYVINKEDLAKAIMILEKALTVYPGRTI